MAKQYTLEEVKEIVYSGKVDTYNLSDLIISLKDYDFNNDIRNIFISLSQNENLPETIRVNFKNVVESYSGIDAPVITNEEKKEEVAFKEPEITKLPTENQQDIQHYKPAPRVGYQGNDEEISLENDAILGGLVAYASFRGMKVLSSNPGLNGKPEISFELNYESKPYIDNLLLSLHENKDDINVDLTRVSSSGQEMLTIDIDNPELSQQELQEKSKKLFNDVNNIIKETDEKKNYEAMMPDHLKALKDKFHGDDPNIPNEDFKVGYSRSNGENTYYLVANSKEQAIELAELMGYEVKKDRGGNVFEVDTKGQSMEGSKLDTVSENVNEIDELKETENGISDVDINYNNKHYGDEQYDQIEEFIANSKDPDTMSVIQIDVPDATPNQRIVNLASEDGARRTIVFNDGKDFDNYTLPKIAEAYGNGTTIDKDNATKTEYGNGKSGYDVLSSDNNYLRMNNFDSSVVENVDNSLSSHMTKEENSNELSNSNVKSNAYSKKLGTYPTNTTNSEAANTSFAALAVFVLVMTLGFGVIYLLFGG